jgi:hypothetical protein
VHRPVPQTAGMHDGPPFAINDFVALVHDIKPVLIRRGLYIPVHSCPFVATKAENAMPKIDVNKVAEILKKNELDPAILRRVIEEMNLAVQPDPGEEEKPPPVKKQFVILVSDPNGVMPDDDLVGWVLQIPENDSPATAPERVYRAAYEFNATKKGRLLPAKTVGDTLENVPAKHFKEADVWVKTKTPVLVLKTNNEIPTDDLKVEKGRRLDREDEDDE